MHRFQPTRRFGDCRHHPFFRAFVVAAASFSATATIAYFLIIALSTNLPGGHLIAYDKATKRTSDVKPDKPPVLMAGTSADVRCNSECFRLRRLVDAWPPDKPRAAIVMLLHRQSITTFTRSAPLLHANFNAAYGYPIIIFHESDINTEEERDRLRHSVADPSLLFFQRVAFDIPPFVNRSAVPREVCFKKVGYRHMCRFHAKTIYDEPILAGLRYVWRLDDDSFILHPVGYDVFRVMADRRIRYAYALVAGEYQPCVAGLWSAVKQYMAKRNLRQRFRWPETMIFYNNFEVSDLELWRSQEYRDFVDYVDRLGGIYYRRWGDAPIKTIAVTLFVSKNDTHHFKDIAYKHGRRTKI